MVFKKMMQKFGVGGPSVDTVLDDPHCVPGGRLTGEVRLVGGEADAAIEHIALSLTVQGGRGGRSQLELHRVVVAEAMTLAAKEQREIRFTLEVPWETPVTEVSGQQLPGMELGLRTELSIAKAVDKGDLDPVFVAPLPSQDAVLDAIGVLDFQFNGATVMPGKQTPVQAMVFFPPPNRPVPEVMLVMIAGADGLTVIMETTNGVGIGHTDAAHDEAVDWPAKITEWLDQLAANPHLAHGYDDDEYGGGRRGPGMGGMVAGAAGGVVGGMMLGEMLDGDDGGFF
ncbi:sporulation-control protein [Herbihabitans rhizosphaerae]|uniref:Sporulation-control protein n=1 Tax=Herbihabitans rhizosphaerae TaxID=1872711 RepID=A0A4Q7L0L8_9PSEU|nr:sporulation protein [Herbihabitans rhizosphaerae]RZS43028.1 sporulation-control protein [Herbihabitans rhizosphaerae]